VPETDCRVALVGYAFQTERLRRALTGALAAGPLQEFDLQADDYEASLRAFAPDIIIQYGSETTDEPKETLNARYRLAPRIAPTWFAENAWLPQKDYLYLDPEGLADQSSVARLSAAELPAVDRHRLAATLAAYRDRVLPAGERPRREDFLLLCLQMPQDTVIVRASPIQDMQALIDRVEATFPDMPIVVRPHPDDPGEYRTQRATLCRQGAVAEWIVRARLVMACNSTTLLEAMALGVPAAALGRGLFSGKGVCWEWTGAPGQLRTCLDFRPDGNRVDAFLWELARRQIPLCDDVPDHRAHNPVLLGLKRDLA
jgi:hypothetical protein